VPDSYNTILVATRQPTSAQNLAANLAALPAGANPVLREALTVAVDSLRPTAISQTRFTDDRAPVESIVDAMVIEFLLTGGIDELDN
jgi:hypothetical protein